MASEWGETTIGNLIESGLASLQTGPFGTVLKAAEYTKVGVPLISVREIRHGHLEIGPETPRVSEATTKRLPTYVLREGDIVFGRKGGVDRNSLISAHQDGWFLGSDGIRLRLATQLDARFIGYQLRSTQIQEWLLQHSEGTTMASMNQKILGRLPLTLPPLNVQRDIAELLSCLDIQIDTLSATSAALETLARSIFKSWFVDFDPVRAKAEGREPEGMDAATAALFPQEFEESTVGQMPMGWQIRSLREISKIGSGKRPENRSNSKTESSPIPLYGGAGIMGYTSSALSNKPAILTGRVGTLGLVWLGAPPFWASDNTLVVSPNEAETNEFIHLSMQKMDLASLNRGSTQPLLTQTDLGLQRVCVPPPAVMRVFHGLASPLYERVAASDIVADTLANVRDTLLPRLIAGKLRVPLAEELLEAAL